MTVKELPPLWMRQMSSQLLIEHTKAMVEEAMVVGNNCVELTPADREEFAQLMEVLKERLVG